MDYTKGKWKVVEYDTTPYRFRIETDKNVMAQVHSKINAQLIAAAPDMYEALRGLLRDYSTNPLDDKFYEASLKARQALAKAEGE